MEKIFFHGGLNSDDEPRAIPAGDFPCGQMGSSGPINVRIGTTDQGNDLCVENVRGNSNVAYTLPGGYNQVIGTLRDELTSTITYCVYNSSNYHSILQYSWLTGNISLVARGIALGFDLNHKITGLNLINGMFYWTDRLTEPHKINAVNAILGFGNNSPIAAYNVYNASTNPGGVDQANTFTQGQLNLQEYIYTIKTPPLYPPSAAYATDTTRDTNFMNGYLFQFNYRYIFDDFEKSAFSPITILPLPQLSTALFTDTPVNNQITLGINSGSAIVKKIEIAVRIGNTGPFNSVVVIDKNDPLGPLTDNTPSFYKFYNDGIYVAVNVSESEKLFDAVPKLAGAQDLIEGPRISYGDVTDSFDPVTVVAKLAVSFPPSKQTTFSIQCNAGYRISPVKSPGFVGVPNYNGDKYTDINAIAQPAPGINQPFIGGVHIISPWTSGTNTNGQLYDQPIVVDLGNKGGPNTVFGGWTIGSGGNYLPTPNISSDYGQNLPLG